MTRFLLAFAALGCLGSTALAQTCAQTHARAVELDAQGKSAEAAHEYGLAGRLCGDQYPGDLARARQLEDQGFMRAPVLPGPEPVADPPPQLTPPEVAYKAPPEATQPLEEPTNAARVELMIGQALHGITLSTLFCTTGGVCPSLETGLGMAALGGVAGAGLSFFASSEGVRPGTADAINSGSLWGMGNGLLLGSGLNAGGGGSGTTVALAVAAGGALGTGAGVLVSFLAQPTAGQVSMTNSGVLWSVVSCAWVLGAMRSPPPVSQVVIIAVSANTAMAGMALLSRYVTVSRSRMFLIDLGGALGMLTGLGASAVFGAQAELRLAFVMGGMAGGLISTALLTRPLDEQPALPRVTLMPGGPRGTPGLHAALVF